MTLKETFCPSPWIHTRVEHDGSLYFCRWQTPETTSLDKEHRYNLRNTSLLDFFRNETADFRKSLLSGERNPLCEQCYKMESGNKDSGREKQLLKAGIQLDQFEKTLLSSPMLPYFKESQESGATDLYPLDLQLNMGNYCNGACIYCTPLYSSRLHTEWTKLGFEHDTPPRPWAEDPELVDKFIEDVKQMPMLRYLHLLGGENMIMPAMTRILRALIDVGTHRTLTVGLTTNLSTWNEEAIGLLKQFNSVHLGMSIDADHPVNDYVRYPSRIGEVRRNINRYLELDKDWLYQLRPTQTLFSIYHFDTLLDFAWNNGIGIESCNFLNWPKHLMLENLNEDLRDQTIAKIERWIGEHQEQEGKATQLNVRNPRYYREGIVKDAQSYVNYLRQMTLTKEHHAEMIRWIKALEANRNNSILDYLPEYEEFLRTAGY